MKRVFMLCFVLLCLTSCRQGTDVPTRPDDTMLEFWITEDVESVDFSNHREITGWFGARQFYGLGYQPLTDAAGNETEPEHFVKYKISSWPDYADGGQYITQIEITDPNVTVYGLRADSSFEEFDAVFQAMEFELSTLETASDTDACHVATRNGISFSLRHSDGKNSLTIHAEVTNHEGIVF